jgi:hypothetical protein
MRRWLPAVLIAALALTGCTKQEKADDVDRQRIDAMKGEAIVAGVDGVPKEGAGDGGDYAPNSYSAFPVSGVRAASASAAREQAAKLVAQLRTQGWTVVSDRCTPPASGSYTWEAYAYKVRDQVPYGAKLTASYSLDSGLTVNVTQQAPFHADTKAHFQPAPAALATTCVEGGDVEHPGAAQGNVWGL